jgi:hypothetical protein
MQSGSGRSQNCEATLRINGQDYDGSTGKDHGHAEMDALHNFIMDNPGNRSSVSQSVTYCANLLGNPNTPKSVSCPSRPCCLKCTRVLKALGFQRAAKTSWSDTSMGSTEWGASLIVRQLLAARNIDYEAITGLA